MKTAFVGLACASLFLAFSSCKTTPDNFSVEQVGEEYYPLEVGKYWIYEVDSTIYDPTGDTMISFSKTLMKEEITDTIMDYLGNVIYRFERYERKADTLPWNVSKVFTASIDGNLAIRTEDNLRFIKMTFPLRVNNRWDGNLYFDNGLIVTVAGESVEMFKSWSYRVKALGVQDTVGGQSFGDVAVIQEADAENQIELRRSFSTYAKGIGLIAREMWILDTQCIESCDGQTWEEKAEKGFILHQTMLEHN
ncbi:MAG: hypothetical protein R2830_16385 [Saprospiraceae bacterium]